MKFFDRQKFCKRGWVLMTVRQKRWEMKGGDLRPFSVFNSHSNIDDITDIPELRNLIQSLRRIHKKLGIKEPLFIVASVETTFQVVNNKDVTKPFHFHLIISGLTKSEIEEASKKMKKNLGPSVSGMARAVDIRKVGPSKRQFIKAMSYLLKQPFWRISKASKDDKQGLKQTPEPHQLSELVNNFGPLKCTGRFVFVGLKFHAEKFRLIK